MPENKKSTNNPTEHIDLGRTIPMPSDRIKPTTPPPPPKEKK
jgi:hypothetical protein